MKKNIDKTIERILEPTIMVNVKGLDKSKPKYDFHILNTLRNCIWNSISMNILNPSYCIKNKVGNIIHFNDELEIELYKGINEVVETTKHLNISVPNPYTVSMFEYFYQEGSNNDTTLYYLANENIGTSKQSICRGSIVLYVPISELTQEDYYDFIGKDSKDIKRHYITEKEKVFLILHSYNKKRKKFGRFNSLFFKKTLP